MDGSIQLSPHQRKALLRLYRSGNDTATSRRAHIILLLADGWSYRQVRLMTYASFALVSDCADRFRRGGIAGLSDGPAAEQPPPAWLGQVVAWLTGKTPEDFGYFRCRWSCETLAEVLAWETGISLSAETIRRGLRRAGFVWRRPRPVLARTDPEHESKLRRSEEHTSEL